MARDLPEHIDKAIDWTQLAEVVRRFKLDLIVLFGSHARGEARPDSDVDVAVRTLLRGDQRGTIWEERTCNALELAVGREIDLTVLNGAPPFLMSEVADDGIPIFESEPGVFAEFQWYARRRDMDEFKVGLWEKVYIYDDDTELLKCLGTPID